MIYQWFCVRLQYLWWVNNGDKAVLHQTIDIYLHVCTVMHVVVYKYVYYQICNKYLYILVFLLDLFSDGSFPYQCLGAK